MKMLNITFFILLLQISNVQAQSDTLWNQKNDKGQKEGKWRAYHKNGKLKYVGQFKENQPFDVFRYFFSTGDLQTVLEFENPKTAKAKLFYQTGDLMAEGIYSNQKKEGEWISYGADNVKIEKGFYKSGAKMGVWKTFYPSGKVSSELNFLNDKKEGIYKTFYEDGKLKQEAVYKEGILNGLSVFYRPGGKKFLKGIYKNDNRDANWIYYDESQKVEKVLKYKEGTLLNPEILETIDYGVDSYRNNIKDVLEFDDLRGKIRYE